MKFFAKLVQIAIALAILYPIVTFFDHNNLEQTCRKVQKGMTMEEFIDIGNNGWVKLINPQTTKGKWTGSFEALSPLSSRSCRVNGKSNKVLETQLLD